MGRAVIEQMKMRMPDEKIMAVGTNALATAAMLRAGADYGASGENAVIVNARDAELILGPIGVVIADALMGEVSPAMAAAVGSSAAHKVLVPVGKCRVQVAGMAEISLAAAVDSCVEKVREIVASCRMG